MNRSRTALLGVALIAVIVLLTLSGCGFIAQKAVEGATGVKVSTDNGTVSIQGTNGASATLGQTQVPDGFPADVPVYAGTVKMGNRVQSTSGTVYQVSIDTPDGAKTVADWYAGKLKDGGWTIDARNDASVNGKDVSTISAKNGNETALIIVGSQSDGAMTVVNIQVQSK